MLFLYFEERIEECLRKEWRKKHSFIFPLINADVVKDRLGGEHLEQSDLLKILGKDTHKSFSSLH